MNNELINQLSKLTLEQQAIKRNLNRNYYNKTVRNKLFSELELINKEINKVKFAIRLEREKKK